jgi:hypothetical protein
MIENENAVTPAQGLKGPLREDESLGDGTGKAALPAAQLARFAAELTFERIPAAVRSAEMVRAA